MRHILSLLVIGFLFASCTTYRLRKADKKFHREEYATAGDLYRSMYNKTSSRNKIRKSYLSFRLGECYRQTYYTTRAIHSYKNALRYQYPDSLLLLRIAQVLHKDGQYEEAISYYNRHLLIYPNHILAQNGRTGCRESLTHLLHPSRYEVRPATRLNSNRTDYNPVFYKKDKTQIYFLSSRVLNMKEGKDPATGLPPSHLWYSRHNQQGEWIKPFPEEQLSFGNYTPGPFCFTPAGDHLYSTVFITRRRKKKEVRIDRSRRTDSKWDNLRPFISATDAKVLYPIVSPDGRYLYFASDRTGGYGGFDLYRAFLYKDSIGEWENLGPEINSPGNEVAPYWKDEHTFYFSSDGHPGMGGLDIFKATVQPGNKWEIRYPGHPINSAGEDVGIIFETDRKGLFASNRNHPKGYFQLYTFEWKEPDIRIEGTIKDRDRNSIANGSIQIVSNQGRNEKIHIRGNGYYSFALEENSHYTLMASAPGYLNQPVTFRTDSMGKDETYLIHFTLTPISTPVINDILLYDSGSFSLPPHSQDLLNRIVELLENAPYITIEIKSHTDRHGNHSYNQQLSQSRVKKVITYLTEKGIEAERIVGKGYGKEQPNIVTPEAYPDYPFIKEEIKLTPEYIEQLPPEEQKIADQLNRRTEFRILSLF